MRVVAKCWVLVLVAALAWSCQGEPAWQGDMPQPDRALFESSVYPLLLRDCAFSECHGAPQRFLRVYGSGRSRLPGSVSDPNLVAREHEVSYERAASMLIVPPGVSILEAPLLKKPLELGAGGASHEGTDSFGRNLFQTTGDPRFRLLLQWALSQPAVVTPPTAASPVAGMQPGLAGAPAVGAVRP
jgi:hypothetical protein